MVWERRYFSGGDEGWENIKTRDVIYVTHRTRWEVILNGKTISFVNNEKIANMVMDDYILEH